MEAELNTTKLKSGLGDFYSIQQEMDRVYSAALGAHMMWWCNIYK